MLDTSPKNFGRYEVVAELGSGAMGVVYRAHDPVIGRNVAIKTIKRTLDLPSPKREEYLERFHREARAAGKLSDHPNIVPVFDVGREGDLPYIVMSFIEGESLDRARRKNHIDENDLHAVARDMCLALGHAHRNGTIHRDVKPANILMTPRGAMLTDFGIARLDGSELTRAGTFLGSPSYMSPEQVRGGELTGSSDLFSLAVILYLLLTGDKPFKGDDTNEILYKIVHDKHQPPSKVDEALAKWDAFFERALAKDAAQRFADADEFYQAFAAVLGAGPGASTHTAPPASAAPSVADAPPPAAPRQAAKPLAPFREERVNPLADRSIFHGVDVKHHIPSRRASSTESGRLDRLLKSGGRRRSRDGSLPPAVWVALVIVVLALGSLLYALWPSPVPEKSPAKAAPAAAKKGTSR
jgi:serine/threonine-protein kinase